MITLIRLELLRLLRDRKFWFWSLVGVPILIPAVVVLFAFAMASTGTVEPANTKPLLATDTQNTEFLAMLEAVQLPATVMDDRDAVEAALTAGDYSVGLVELDLTAGQPLRATLLSVAGTQRSAIHEHLYDELQRIARERRTALIDDLSFDGPSFDVLLEPIELREQHAPARVPSGLLQMVVLIWSSVLLFPYLILTWNSGSRVVTDRLSGYLAPLNASSMPPWQWLVVRWSALSIVGISLVLVSSVLFALYMRAYATVADMLVAEGVLNALSDTATTAARAYLVDTVAIWRDTSILSWLLWLVLAMVQISAAVAVVIWGSATAGSLAQYRLYELLAFALIFLLPLFGLGALATGSFNPYWIPGLNAVLSIEPFVTASHLEAKTFAVMGAVLLTNAVLIIAAILLGSLSLRNEKLWAV